MQNRSHIDLLQWVYERGGGGKILWTLFRNTNISDSIKSWETALKMGKESSQAWKLGSMRRNNDRELGENVFSTLNTFSSFWCIFKTHPV